MLAPMPSLSRVRRFYDRDPSAYHRGMQSPISEWLVRGRREKVGELVSGRVLDIGIGTGLSLPHYPPSLEPVGIDASLAMLKYAQGESVRLCRPVRLLQMDAARLAFDDHSFDSVAFNLCLCTIGEPERAVREAIRVVKPGGTMVFLEHVRSHVLPVAIIQELFSPILLALEADHFNRRTVQVVRRAGVEILSVDRWFAGIFNLIVGRAPGAVSP